MMSGGRIRADWKLACLAIALMMLLRFCRDGFVLDARARLYALIIADTCLLFGLWRC